MAQLSDDCFAFGGPMMSVDEAVGLIAARVTAVSEVESVALAAADGRVLAHDIAAPLPLPPFTNSRRWLRGVCRAAAGGAFR